MTYQVLFRSPARKSLEALPKATYELERAEIFSLGLDPRPHGCRKLRDREGWRIRVGDYRVIYCIDDAQRLVKVTHVGHRSDVYRG